MLDLKIIFHFFIFQLTINYLLLNSMAPFVEIPNMTYFDMLIALIRKKRQIVIIKWQFHIAKTPIGFMRMPFLLLRTDIQKLVNFNFVAAKNHWEVIQYYFYIRITIDFGQYEIQ